MSVHDPNTEDAALSDIEEEIDEPFMYKVLIHNDDYTTMEFVVEILMSVFNKSMEEATIIMMKVHKEGVGLCGVYTYEVAETKVYLVNDYSKKNKYPLKCTMEEAEE